jgi:hypothetical protein
MSAERPPTAKQAWAWPESLDALVAAAGSHTLLFENERVRVVQTLILPGDSTAIHTHRWPSMLFVFASSDLVRFDERGNVLMDTREAGKALKLHSPVWQEALPPHSVKNVGGAEFRGVQVELKDAT